jgi:transposase
VQVKYEMLRRVSIEKASVTEATEEYGVSRPTYYQTKSSFDKGGLAGLVPRKRGPHGPHKLQGEALAFVQQQLVAGQPVRARELAKLVRQRFDLAIHPRTIERAVAGKKTSR